MYFQYVNENDIKVKPADKKQLNKLIEYDEICMAVYSMKNGKTPGSNGLPIEVYKTFWSLLGHEYHEALVYCLDIQNELTLTMKHRLLCMIPKKDRNPNYVRNWRLLTLMNTDHRILAKVLARRMTPIMSYIIGEQQTGYIKGRFIGINIHRMMDIIQHMDKHRISGLMISVDFERCFDSIEFLAIEGALKSYDFGDRITKYIMMLYKGFHTAVIHNGNVSEYFFPEKGIHQGCAVSGFLFLLDTIILSTKIKHNQRIKRIKLSEEYSVDPVSQFVDDMCLFVKNDEQTLSEITSVFEDFHCNTGLKTNFDKTIIYRIGDLKNTNYRINTSKQFKWDDSNILALGVVLDQMDEHKQYADVLNEMRNTLQLWRQRDLTLKGKIQIANSLAGSLLIYKMQFMPTISEELGREISKILQQFIWNGRKPKLKLQMLQMSIDKGGLRLFNPIMCDVILKLVWIQRILTTHMELAQLARLRIKPCIQNQEFWLSNFHLKDVHDVCKATGFWLSVVEAWSRYNYHNVVTINQILNQRLWCNSHIRVKNEVIMYEELSSKGIYTILDLINNNGNSFKTHVKISSELGMNVDFLTYYALISAVPNRWKKMIKLLTPNLDMSDDFKINMFLTESKINCKIYDDISRGSAIESLINKWSQKGVNFTAEEIKTGLDTKEVTLITKYQSFQYRLLHQIVFLNDRLYHMK